MTEENLNVGWNLENTYTELPELLYTAINVNPVSNPKLVILNDAVATSLGLNSKELESTLGVEVSWLQGDSGRYTFSSGLCWSSIWKFYHVR